MQGHTFRTRVSNLIQKSRKALRLYTGVGRMQRGTHGELSDMQISEWREVNASLVKHLVAAMEEQSLRRLIAEVFMLRDRFYGEWRLAEAEVHENQNELISSAENGDYIKAALISRKLVLLKAREQATQAAHHELQTVIQRSGVSQPAVEIAKDTDAARTNPAGTAKILPLRRNQGGS